MKWLKNRAVFTKSEDEQNLTESGTLEDAMQGAFDVISGAEMMAVKVDGDCNGQDPNITFTCGHSSRVRITRLCIPKLFQEYSWNNFDVY